jgi:hypothetical protein
LIITEISCFNPRYADERHRALDAARCVRRGGLCFLGRIRTCAQRRGSFEAAVPCRATFRLSARDAERIEAEGANRLDAESDTKRFTTDEQTADALQSLATHHGPVSDALTGLARSLKNDDTARAEAAREFIGVVRRSVEGGLGEGDQSGLHRRGTEGAGEDAPAVEPPVEGQDALFSRRRDRAEGPSVPRCQPLDNRLRGLRAAPGGPDVDVGLDGEPMPELVTALDAVPSGMRQRA